jgi:arsenate reductase (glutaredoxin)
MPLVIYHNPRCAKSRKGLKYLQSKTTGYTISDYIKNGITVQELNEIVLKINLKPIDLVRTNEELFKKELKGRSFTDEEWLTILSENPRLLRRPVIVGKHKAVLGDPVENIDIII